jgi:hypothetical protein
VARGKGSTASSYDFVDFTYYVDEDENCGVFNPKDTLTVPHSNAFVDLDGDCLPDLLLTVCKGGDCDNTNYQIYS